MISRFNYLIFVFILFSCTEEFIPKPKGFNKIDLPQHQYQKLEKKHPFVFDYSIYAKVLKDSSWMSEPHWIDIYYPDYKCNIQITYKDFQVKNKIFDELINDAHKLTNKHNIRAYAIDEISAKTPKGYHVTMFELSGEVPSQFQFYVTDSAKHFLRGALYFRTAIKNDSLAPVIEYMKADAKQLINSIEFVQ
ncbi:MAG: gliding motility lipoprotein GldD [Cytophagales bacterium]|nr:MAG: gliding motility lipoprotein GldD [Cytophagales bacterium]